ncbi:MAG: hypothetical protein KKB31_04235 [Nanoarchaeota archaeon]|nr:hypothetical protein [Nanoarchaeota archaeon]
MTKIVIKPTLKNQATKKAGTKAMNVQRILTLGQARVQALADKKGKEYSIVKAFQAGEKYTKDGEQKVCAGNGVLVEATATSTGKKYQFAMFVKA